MNSSRFSQTRPATPEPLSVNFQHRLSASATDTIDSGGLVDSVGLMANRARGVLMMLYCQFDDSCGSRISDAHICAVIDAALQKVEDIDATVKAYCYSEHANKQA